MHSSILNSTIKLSLEMVCKLNVIATTGKFYRLVFKIKQSKVNTNEYKNQGTD